MRRFLLLATLAVAFTALTPAACLARTATAFRVYGTAPATDESGITQYWHMETTSVPTPSVTARLGCTPKGTTRFVALPNRAVHVFFSERNNRTGEREIAVRKTNSTGYLKLTMAETGYYRLSYNGSDTYSPASKYTHRFIKVQHNDVSSVTTEAAGLSATKVTVRTDWEFSPNFTQNVSCVSKVIISGSAGGEGDAPPTPYDGAWEWVTNVQTEPFFQTPGFRHTEFATVIPNYMFEHCPKIEIGNELKFNRPGVYQEL